MSGGKPEVSFTHTHFRLSLVTKAQRELGRGASQGESFLFAAEGEGERSHLERHHATDTPATPWPLVLRFLSLCLCL